MTQPDAPEMPLSDPIEEGKSILGWMLFWLVLPNVAFLPIALVGGPVHYPEILIAAMIGLVSRKAPWPVRLLLFLGIFSYACVMLVSRLFNMPVGVLAPSIGMLGELDPFASPEYVIASIAIVATVIAAFFLARRNMAFASLRSFLLALLATAILAGADLALSWRHGSSYDRTAAGDTPFSSAVTQSGLAKLADRRANIMLVMVEAMGEPSDPVLKQQLSAIWITPEIRARYDVRQGTTPYFGSTTSGEMRELCGRWGDYIGITKADPTCLPAQLAAQGYETRAYHGFDPDFFERRQWYPKIGFQKIAFGPDLLKRGIGLCESVFSGACDDQIPELIKSDIAGRTAPQFTYWLTLNSHLPTTSIVADDAACKNRITATQGVRLPMICTLFTIWTKSGAALSQLATSKDFPDTAILIVGDHMPPIVHQRAREQFAADRVPWILLTPKSFAQPVK